jgi:hypothetical protein
MPNRAQYLFWFSAFTLAVIVRRLPFALRRTASPEWGIQGILARYCGRSLSRSRRLKETRGGRAA